MIKIETIPVGELLTNCYLVSCPETLETIIIDPGSELEQIISRIENNKLIPKYIINTHGHYDHTGANKELKDKYGIPVLIHKDDMVCFDPQAKSIFAIWGLGFQEEKPDKVLQENETIDFGKQTFQVIHTPGHSPGGICLYTPGYLFSGDTLFAQDIGRYDLPGGSFEALIKSIKEKLLVLPEDTKVFPGHGPASIIKEEKVNIRTYYG